MPMDAKIRCGHTPILDPIFRPDAGHARELANVVGHEDQALAAGMGADLNVMRAAGRACPLEFGAELTVVGGGLVGEGKNVEARREMFDGQEVLCAAR